MGPEKKITNDLRDWTYKTYGRIDPVKGTGNVLIKKLTMLGMYGESGHPDLEFNVRGGGTFLMEMKAPGATSTDKQRYMQKCYDALGFAVYYDCDDLERAKVLVDREMRRFGIRKLREMAYALVKRRPK